MNASLDFCKHRHAHKPLVTKITNNNQPGRCLSVHNTFLICHQILLLQVGSICYLLFFIFPWRLTSTKPPQGGKEKEIGNRRGIPYALRTYSEAAVLVSRYKTRASCTGHKPGLVGHVTYHGKNERKILKIQEKRTSSRALFLRRPLVFIFYLCKLLSSSEQLLLATVTTSTKLALLVCT